MKRLIAEFEEQSFTQIIFPHKDTDWIDYLYEAEQTFINIINEIIKYQKCLVVSYDISEVKKHFSEHKNLFFVAYTCDDTWARDCSALCIENAGKTQLLDFTFTAWGGKFEANHDNEMSQKLSKNYSAPMIQCDFILEGGGVESNGETLLLTTSECILNTNRNAALNATQVHEKLKSFFGAEDILTLNHGYLSGDDTDSHIDTLARFIDTKSVMYVKCEDKNDEHYTQLHLMERELQEFAKIYKLRLIALPMSEAIYYKEERLPATYANFLFINGCVLVPTYGVKTDDIALDIFKKTFSDLDVVGIDSTTLIHQHGSLHCVTMNFASGVTLRT